MHPRELRESFNEDPAAYHAARPGYPRKLFSDLVRTTGIDASSHVLEVGAGTGIATEQLLSTRARVTAAELGPELAEYNRARLSANARLEIVVGDFESASLAEHSFDLVCSFTAWHWIDKALREPRAAALLRRRGHLAIVATHHVRDGAEDFAAAVQRCYRRFDRQTPPEYVLPSVAETPELELDGAHFVDPVRFRYEVDHIYSAKDYVALLSTYSGPKRLDQRAREGLFSCIGSLIDEDFGGRLRKRYLFEMLVANRADERLPG